MEKILREIEERLSVFENLYTYIRIVNPEQKIACSRSTDKGGVSQTTCHAFWGRSVPCENCVAIRASQERKASSKIEITQGRTFFVQALPMLVEGETYIVEMLKYITEDQLLFVQEQGSMDLEEYIRVINVKLVTDELTGLYNRRFIAERLPADIYYAKSHDYPIAIVMADIDYFKKINDTYGHLVGDCVLKELANLMHQSVSEPMHWVARYGGEEFMMVLNHIEQEQVWSMVERLRQSMEAHIFHCNGQNLRVTCSFGISFIHDTDSNVTKAIEDADRLLYQAKQSGRNRAILEPAKTE